MKVELIKVVGNNPTRPIMKITSPWVYIGSQAIGSKSAQYEPTCINLNILEPWKPIQQTRGVHGAGWISSLFAPARTPVGDENCTPRIARKMENPCNARWCGVGVWVVQGVVSSKESLDLETWEWETKARFSQEPNKG